jgi:thiamine biosynthesis lipoprotein
VQHSLLSATVLTKDCAVADAYATSFMVLGMERAKEVLAKHPELKAYFIYANENGDFDVWYTPSLKDKTTE